MSERMYEGKRLPTGDCLVDVIEDGRRTPLPLRLDLDNKSPVFDWGHLGVGPAQLALALLADASGDNGRALYFALDFKRRFVSNLPQDRWSASRESVLLVLSAIERDLTQPGRNRLNHNFQGKRR